MKREKNKHENYLERIPIRPESLIWSMDSSGMVTLDIENKGVWNRIAQRILKKPETSHIHLDEMGSFLFARLDGQMNIIMLGRLVRGTFGEKAEPLYERLAQYLQILDRYHLIEWKHQ